MTLIHNTQTDINFSQDRDPDLGCVGPVNTLLYPDIRTAILPTLTGTFHDTVRGPLVVSTGNVKDETCGKWFKRDGMVAAIVCPTNPGHQVRALKHSCNRPECPECAPRYLQVQSERVATRVDGYLQAVQDLQQTLDGEHGRPVYRSRHFMISPPASVVNRILRKCRIENSVGNQDYDEKRMVALFREEGYKAFDVSGLDGAAVIIHWYRPRKELAGIIDRKMREGGYKDRWQFITHQKNWRDYVAFSPHIHLVAYGYALDTNDFYEASGGWTIRMIRKAKTTQGLIYYLLSHASPVDGRVSVTYKGCLSNRRLKTESQRWEKEDIVCPDCEKERIFTVMCHALVDEEFNVVQLWPDRPAYRKILKKKYRIVQVAGPPLGVDHSDPRILS